MIFKDCRLDRNDKNYCQKNCIKPKGRIIAKINEVKFNLRSKDKNKEIFPPSKGKIELIDDCLFFSKKKCEREKTYFISYSFPNATVAYIPKEKKGLQCFSFKFNQLLKIRHSIIDNLLGVYLIFFNENGSRYFVRISKRKKLSTARDLVTFIDKIQDVSVLNNS
jgi:hypothetical protein